MALIKNIIGKEAFTAADYTRQELIDPRGAMLAAARATGLRVPDFLLQGAVTRFPDAEDKPGKKSGWLWYNTFAGQYGEVYVARFGSWRSPDDRIEWCSSRPEDMSRDDLRQLNEHMEAARRIAEAEREAAAVQASKDAAEELRNAQVPDQAHPYLARKGIAAPPGVRQSGDRLLIPITDGQGRVTSYQAIYPNGDKRFKVGGVIKGCSFTIAGTDDIVICEGLATGASIHAATGFTVVIAFNAGNLADVAAGVTRRSRLIIAADDDRFTATGNTGVLKAQGAADIANAEVVMPIFAEGSKGTDFNDMAAESGLDAVRACFAERKVAPARKEKAAPVTQTWGIEDVPPGFISQVYSYYMATSGFDQRGFALNTALAIASVICGRNFQTDEEPGNRTSLYFICVGNTSSGKEHVKTVIERVMRAAGMPLVMGDGFTSAGAVFSALLTKPRFISVIDELGMYLEAAKQKSVSQVEANSALMQCFSRTHSVMRPKNYSSMTLGKKQREEVENREVENPAVTLVGMTTPSTFFSAISSADIHSGFINRFIIHLSNLPIMPRKRTLQLEVPEQVAQWARAVADRSRGAGNLIEVASQEANVITIPFSQAARDIQEAFAIEVAAKQNELLKERLEGLGGRVVEIAMRLSLILALSRDPQAEIIADIDMLWSVNFMRERFAELVRVTRDNMRSGDLDNDMMDIVAKVRAYGSEGVRKADLIKAGGVFRKYRPDHLDKILAGLVDADMIQKETTSTGGRPTVRYFASSISG